MHVTSPSTLTRAVLSCSSEVLRVHEGKMLLCPQHRHQHLYPSAHVSGCHRRRYNPSDTSNNLHFTTTIATGRSKVLVVSSSVLHRDHQTAQTPDHEDTGRNEQILRKHNARSTALLLRHVSQLPEDLEPKDEEEEEQQVIVAKTTLEEEEEEEKIRLLEMSLVKRRTPQFPGSIYLRSHGGAESGASPPPLHQLFRGEIHDIDDDKMLIQAIEIRRKVTAEIFKEAMRGGRFSITYSTNLVSSLPDFIDYIMIEAASMKRLPDFSHSTFNARAKTVISNSNVIPLIRWLKHNSLTYPQIGKLICKCCRNLESIRQLVDWLKSIYVKGELIGATLVKAGPTVLERNTEELDKIVGYLESNGVRREWMGFVVSRCPQLLSYTFEEIKSRVSFYLDMGMNQKDFGTMVFDYPKALGFLTLDEMNVKVNYLKEFGLSTEEVGRLLAFKPQLMGCSIEERWKPFVKYMYYLGVRRDGMRRILTIKPMVFCVDLETTIAPKVRFLQDIGIREDAIGSMLVKFPPLLTYSLYKKIRPVVIFLMTKAGVSQKDIGKVIALGPELLGCSITHKLEVNVKYFLSLGIPLLLLGEMIADFPMLLRYNLDVLRPKYRYLRRIMVRPLQDLIEFPRFFSYSLDGRIIPRHKIMVENRINFKLRYMLASTDEEFKQRVDAAVERRRRFESNVPGSPSNS
ncbi:PREDICTED: transcription termination factor MTERF2, chloroplastic [Nelumbo nucifera]|uniref:Transcription termination factor MTERF2, chloroplastic n=1 Tax=Nelumbo nucifera TaxID=4432 RepID=A0A1U7ZZY6_NELNU|nr:PREDICTED: transcription termination factor MTERF2, chloroplastic [Nelumbo nucifera]